FASFASLAPLADPRGTRGSRTTRSPVPPASGLRSRRDDSLDEEWRQHQCDRRQQLDQDVQARAGRVFEGISDGVADDGRSVRWCALAKDLARLVLEHPGFDVLLRVVP